jgi:hypothetical protein
MHSIVAGHTTAFFVLLSSLMGSGLGQAHAADHFIAPSTSSVDCQNFSGGIKPGDTITLAAGMRGALRVRNCAGTTQNPIFIRNDTSGRGPTVMRRTSAQTGGFVFECTNCTDVVIDGTGKWNGAPSGAYCGAPDGRDGCGIKITATVADDSPSTFLKLQGTSTRVTVRGVEIDGRWPDLNTGGIGIQTNDSNVTVSTHPDLWREDMVYEQNYIHHTYMSALYIGPNWSERIPLRNITIRQNLVENLGRKGLILKSAIEGTNRIHHNVVRNVGIRGASHHGAGIQVFEGGSDLRIYNNWVQTTGSQGVHLRNENVPSSYGPFDVEIYNNVIYDAGAVLPDFHGSHGITVGFSSESAAFRPNVYHNTIVKPARAGIDFGSGITQGVARDNIISEWGTSALSIGANTNTNNLTGTASTISFVSRGDLNFDLTSSSPARDTASRSGTPQDDYLGVKRPQGTAADRGAFEFADHEAAPNPPQSTQVQ